MKMIHNGVNKEEFAKFAEKNGEVVLMIPTVVNIDRKKAFKNKRISR